jgi:hypothetical protein
LLTESQRLSELNTLLENPTTNDISTYSSSSPTSYYHSLEDDTLDNLTLDGGKHDEAYVEKLQKQLRSALTRLREVEANFDKIKVKFTRLRLEIAFTSCFERYR